MPAAFLWRRQPRREMQEFQRIRMSERTPAEHDAMQLQARLLFRFNQAEPYSLEQQALLEQLFGGSVPDGTMVATPLSFWESRSAGWPSSKQHPS